MSLTANLIITLSLGLVGFVIGWVVKANLIVPNEAVRCVDVTSCKNGGSPEFYNIDTYNDEYYSTTDVQDETQAKIIKRKSHFKTWDMKKARFNLVKRDDIFVLGKNDNTAVFIGLKALWTDRKDNLISTMRTLILDYKNRVSILNDKNMKLQNELDAVKEKDYQDISKLKSFFMIPDKSKSGGYKK